MMTVFMTSEYQGMDPTRGLAADADRACRLAGLMRVSPPTADGESSLFVFLLPSPSHQTRIASA